MRPPIVLTDEVRAALLELIEEVAASLDCPDAHVAIVCHGARAIDGATRFDIGLASDATPELVRALRRAFPRRGTGLLRATMGPFGDLNLENVTAPDLKSAKEGWQERRAANTRSI